MKTTSLLLSLALVACSDDATTPLADGAVADSTGAAVDTRPALDSGVAKCGPKSYPCGPYGTKIGDVVQDQTFDAYADPKYLCKADKEMKLDQSKLRKIALGDLFRGDASCSAPRKQVLWLFIAAGWCHACQDEMKQLAPLYAKGQLDSRILLVNVLFQTASYTPATEAFAGTWLKTYKGTFPLLLDPKFVTGKYFPVKATPMHLLIDLRTMKVLYRQNGSNLNIIGKEIFKYLT